jgi:hypothetical protein
LEFAWTIALLRAGGKLIGRFGFLPASGCRTRSFEAKQSVIPAHAGITIPSRITLNDRPDSLVHHRSAGLDVLKVAYGLRIHFSCQGGVGSTGAFVAIEVDNFHERVLSAGI